MAAERILPPRLAPGARIALVAPAGPLLGEAVERAEARVRGWGFEPVTGSHARRRHGYLSAPDADRAEDFNTALRDPAIDAIWCLRGGYGVMRILEALDWAALAARPRPVIGFSDNTALHLGIQRLGITSLHGPHPAVAAFTPFSAEGVRRALSDSAPAGVLALPRDARHPATVTAGQGEGPLVGGNLSLLAATLGTPWAIRSEGCLLFLEEVGEAAYRIDRLLSQLRLAGVFNGVAGIVVGAINEIPDEGEAHVPSLAELLHDRLGDLGVPVASGFPFGHVDDNWTLPVGARARLDASAGTLELLEAGVS